MTCNYVPLVLNDIDGQAPGGPTPGGWYSVTCVNAVTGDVVVQTEWISDAPTTGSPSVDPRSVALEAENSLRLPSPSMEFNPPTAAVVNLPTWLWIDSSIWHPRSVAASVGSVTAVAVATPTSVAWSMGDGNTVTCMGPGAPFDASEPSDQQSSPCTYIYSASSAGQPTTDGNPNDGSFQVHATVSWSVSWTATGAPGGGSLPSLTTSASSVLRVEQIESIDLDVDTSRVRRGLP